MAIIRCPHCGTANREGSNFCNRCGAALPGLDVPHDEEDEATASSAGEEMDAELDASQSDGETDADSQTEGEAEKQTGDENEPEAPWLEMDFGSEDDAPPFDDDPAVVVAKSAQLLGGLPGLLSPVRIEVSGDELGAFTGTGGSGTQDVDLWRRVRTRMSTAPLLAGFARRGTGRRLESLKIRWLFLALFLAVTLPVILDFAWPAGSVMMLPGVEESYQTIESLPNNAQVLAYWAYDPSTAGEMDLVTLPVATHLFQRQAAISAITQLPGAPATAQRVLERARLQWQQNENLTVAAQGRSMPSIAYLPGGASTLGLVAQDPSNFQIDTIAMQNTSPWQAGTTPDLMLVFAAHADDVQNWLEQVQPGLTTPVVAVVAAGADPVLRPYLDSGQLSGLVSGYDGGFNYQRLMDEAAKRNSDGRYDFYLVLQDWGALVFFLAIVLGNFAAILRRGEGGED